MNGVLTVLAVVIWSWLAVIWYRRWKARREFDRLSITPDQLHDLITTHHDLLILDVRQPLDRRAPLGPRRFPDRHHPRRAFAALVDGCVDIRNSAGDNF